MKAEFYLQVETKIHFRSQEVVLVLLVVLEKGNTRQPEITSPKRANRSHQRHGREGEAKLRVKGKIRPFRASGRVWSYLSCDMNAPPDASCHKAFRSWHNVHCFIAILDLVDCEQGIILPGYVYLL